jgi:hypothetical protein
MSEPGSRDHAAPIAWRARGLLFENCSCQLVCPGHMHFEQLCTHERCNGYWAIRFDDGDFEGTPLGGVKAVIAYDAPRRMVDGGWIEAIFIDESASGMQHSAVDAILRGRAGGPWAVLARFVGRWLETRVAAIRLTDEGVAKRVAIEGALDAVVTQIRGRDRTKPVLFENIFNQIHAPTQVLARGDTRADIGEIVVRNDGTHGLWSTFDWRVAPP